MSVVLLIPVTGNFNTFLKCVTLSFLKYHMIKTQEVQYL